MNNGSLPPATRGLPAAGSNFVPLQPPLFGVMLPPAFTRRPGSLPQPSSTQPKPAGAAGEHGASEREKRSFFKPDFSDLRMCFRQVPTGRVAADGHPLKDLVQVPCPPTPAPPKKKAWCTIL